MRIIKTTAAADKILKALLLIIRTADNDPRVSLPEEAEVTIVPYVNGRERGWSVRWYLANGILGVPAVSFSESRNSDDLVVYPNHADLAHVDHSISDAAWRERRYFKPGQFAEAADAAYTMLLQRRDFEERRRDEAQTLRQQGG